MTVDCGKTCLEMGADCPAYSVDYTQVRAPFGHAHPQLTNYLKIFEWLKGRCFKLDRNTQGRAQELTIREGMSYFEKICLRGTPSTYHKTTNWNVKLLLNLEKLHRECGALP